MDGMPFTGRVFGVFGRGLRGARLVSLLTIPDIRCQVRAATGRDLSYEEIVASAAEGEPVSARVVEEAGRALKWRAVCGGTQSLCTNSPLDLDR